MKLCTAGGLPQLAGAGGASGKVPPFPPAARPLLRPYGTVAWLVVLMSACIVCTLPQLAQCQDDASIDGWWNGTWSAWEIGAGASGACALDAARAAWCWGQQAGAGGEVTAVPTPQAVPGGRRWWWLATGAGGAVCGIEYDWKYPELGENETLINPEAPGGHMYCWGVNRAGLLGGQHADLAYSLEPLRIDVPGMGVGNATAGIDGIAGWGGVSVGPSSACALRLGSDGAPLFCWGHSDRGQLGNGTAGPPGSVQATPRLVSNCDGCDYSSWTAVSVGDGFACGIDDARYISCWGDNRKLQLGGNASLAQSATPIQLDTAAVESDIGPFAEFSMYGGFADVACGETACCALTDISLGGAVWCWGDAFSAANATGPQRVPDAVDYTGGNVTLTWVGILAPYTTVAAADNTTQTKACGVETLSGAVYCWTATAGDPEWSRPVRVPDLPSVSQADVTEGGSLVDAGKASSGGAFSCAQPVSTDASFTQEIYCWGNDSWGQMGRGSPPNASWQAAATVLRPRAALPSPPPPATPVSAGESSGSLSVGAIAGIAVASVAAGIGALLAWLVWRHRARARALAVKESTTGEDSKLASSLDGKGGRLADPLLSFLASQASSSVGTPSLAASRRKGSAPSSHADDLAPWEIDMAEVEMHHAIGQGSFGKVYVGSYRGSQVAIKVLLSGGSLADPQTALQGCTQSHPIMAGLQKEAGIMAKLNHPNCLRLLGVVTSPIPAMVTEYCARGSLCDVLRQARQEPGSPLAASLTLARRLAMALDAARGVQYLHSHTPPILHRDLKSPNLLVDSYFRLKVCDFGLGKFLVDPEGGQLSSVAATNPRWLAPETFAGAGSSAASDVYALGIILWELVSYDIPWPGMSPWPIVNLIRAGSRPQFPQPPVPGPDPAAYERVRAEYEDLASSCWAQEPQERPPLGQAIARLSALIQRSTVGSAPPKEE